MLNLKCSRWLIGLSCLVLVPSSLLARPAPAPDSLLKIYKYQGSLQCQGGGEPLNKMRQQLRKQQIKVLGAKCGVDGLIYPTVCGAADGRINIFTIQYKHLTKAQALGFDLLNNLPDAQLTQCKP